MVMDSKTSTDKLQITEFSEKYNFISNGEWFTSVSYKQSHGKDSWSLYSKSTLVPSVKLLTLR